MPFWHRRPQQAEVLPPQLPALPTLGRKAGPPVTLGYWPAARRNPFQFLLYRRAFVRGFATLALAPDHFDALANSPAGGLRVLHLHWAHQVFDTAQTERAAYRMIDPFLARLARLQRTGVHIVWTVHNVLSHDATFASAEAELRQRLADQVDSLHIMNPDTAALTAPFYQLPAAKIFQVPHPSYGDIYPAFQSRAAARFALRVTDGEKLIVKFGAVQPRKGALRLVRALPAIEDAAAMPLRLILAGPAEDTAFARDVRAAVAAEPRARWHQRYVLDHEIQTYMRAANLVACPYQTGLNSGVAVTAASFAAPLLIPESLAGIFAGDYDATTYRSEDGPDAFIPAVVRALRAPANRPLRRRWQKSHAAARVSDLFFEALRARLAVSAGG